MRRGVCKNILYQNAMRLINSTNNGEFKDEDKLIVIDVREAGEFKENYLPGSISIPVNDLTAKITSVVPNKHQPILLYCSTGSRSIFACQILADMGYEKVYNLSGGIV